MGLSFLAPLFLAGLLAVVVPILVHLTYRHKTDVVEFPSLMFLQQVPFRSMRRQRIRNWLLFALRCAVVLLLALAFARPFIDRPTVAATLSSGAREVVMLVDRSYSMTYGDRWTAARSAARDAINQLSGSDRAALVMFDEVAQLAVRPTADRAVLLGALEAGQPSTRATRYAPALKIAEQLLDETDLPRREVILISDLQRAGWNDAQDARLPEGTQLRLVDLSVPEAVNLTLNDVVLQHESAGAQQRLGVSARLTNQSAEAARDVEVTLSVDGAQAATRRVDVEAGSSAMVSFDSLRVNGRAVRGTVTAGTDPLPLDNSLHFVVQPGQRLGVMVLEPARATSTDSFYLHRALSIGSRPAFQVEARPVGALGAADLVDLSLVVLNDAPPPGGGGGRALRQFVEEGGGLLIALGELTDVTDWQTEEWAAMVPEVGQMIDREAELGGRLASFDSNHPVFEVFRAPRSGDFTAASFYRYRRLVPTPSDRVLAAFDDGSPALVERLVGDGRVLVWSSTLDTYWNALPRQAIFLPFMHQLAKHAAGYRETPIWQTAGEPVDLTAFGAAPGMTRFEVRGPDGESGAHDFGEGSLLLERPGFHDLLWSDDAGDHTAVLAVNVDRRESDLTVMDAEELAAAVTRSGGSAGGASAAAVAPADREARQAFWWYLLLVLLLILAAEGLLANRKSSSPGGAATSYAS